MLHYEFDRARCTFDDPEPATRRARESPEQFMNLAKWLRNGADYQPGPLLVEVAWSYLVGASCHPRHILRPS